MKGREKNGYPVGNGGKGCWEWTIALNADKLKLMGTEVPLHWTSDLCGTLASTRETESH